MTAQPENCLNEKEIEALLSGSPDSNPSERVQQHLESCPDCQAKVEQILGQNAAIIPMVKRTVRDHPSQSDFTLDGSTNQSFAASQDTTADTGQHSFQTIGPYQLIKRLGEGGMGSVWLAEQTQPVRRRVALKLIKPGLESNTIIARFEAERQALALMEHPNIATVLDVGTTPEGQPFFAMEYVAGDSLVRHCNKQRLNLKQRIELFIAVCHAVGHAHQKGIIHRDLKPSNVLVARSGDHATPKVIDFGLAKALSGNLTDQSLATEFGSVLGTIIYMSPEQADLTKQDIDTRSDIYSLGILLYELLTGSTPLTKGSIAGCSLEQLLSMVQHSDPQTPSIRINESAECLNEVSQNFAIEPADLTRHLGRDLDWVVMKAIEKDRSRRYQTTGELISDLENFLGGHPVTARPPTLGYRLTKLYRRRQTAVLSALTMLILMVGGIVGTSIGMYQARVNETMAMEMAASEKLAREESDQRLKHSKNSYEILATVFQNLDPRSDGSDQPLRSVIGQQLQAAAEQLDDVEIGAPDEVAEMKFVLAQAQHGIGNFDFAAELLKEVVSDFAETQGENSDRTITAQTHLALAFLSQGEFKRAIENFETAIERLTEKHGLDSEQTIQVQLQLADCFHRSGQFEQAKEIEQSVSLILETSEYDDDTDLKRDLDKQRGKSLYHDGRFAAAATFFKNVVDADTINYSAEHPATLNSINDWALAIQKTGNIEEAISKFQSIVEIRTRQDGPHDRGTLVFKNNLAVALAANQKYSKAIEIFEDLVTQLTQRYGQRYPSTLLAKANLAAALKKDGSPEQAIAVYENNTIALMNEVFGADHHETLKSVYFYVSSLHALQKPQALGLIENWWAMANKKMAVTSSIRNEGVYLLSELLVASNRTDDAIEILQQETELMKTACGKSDPRTINLVQTLANLLFTANRDEETLPHFQHLLEHARQNYPPDHMRPILMSYNLGVLQLRLGNVEDGSALLDEYDRGYEKLPGIEARLDLESKAEVARLLHNAKALDVANEFLNRTLTKYEENFDSHPVLMTQLQFQSAKCLFEIIARDVENDELEKIAKLEKAESKLATAFANARQLSAEEKLTLSSFYQNEIAGWFDDASNRYDDDDTVAKWQAWTKTHQTLTQTEQR